MEEKLKIGMEEGDVCNREGCLGLLRVAYPEMSCRCHISPPCARCVGSFVECPVCGATNKDEEE